MFAEKQGLFQDPHGGSQSHVTEVSGNPNSSSHFSGHQAHIQDSCIHAGKTLSVHITKQIIKRYT